ncbi:hypothetical protein CKO51_08345 [Rhodopirellula sp. SM50]|nr:hypothetical protein [Rhodopirellula sp. SM50]PAY19953.1 hypothetical protein CKO51_08345 [Rhodopirellula sp. SM50]
MKSSCAFATIALVALCLCTACTPVKQTQTDDAKKRALAENVSNDSAAGYFTYRDSDPDDDDDSPHVPDFFAGMDAISRPAVKPEEKPTTADETTAGSEISADDASPPQAIPDPLLDLLRDDDGPVVRAAVTVDPAELDVSERIGRNTWMAWCAGNEGFWDWLCTDSLGFIDLLKLVDSRRAGTNRRRSICRRWATKAFADLSSDRRQSGACVGRTEKSDGFAGTEGVLLCL